MRAPKAVAAASFVVESANSLCVATCRCQSKTLTLSPRDLSPLGAPHAGLLAAITLVAFASLQDGEARRHGHAERQHALSCRRDNEGTWSIGVFRGSSLESLVPIEEVRLAMASVEC